MKKISILTLCLATAVCGFAQTDVVKDAERAVKGTSPDHAKIRAAIKPAPMQNPKDRLSHGMSQERTNSTITTNCSENAH